MAVDFLISGLLYLAMVYLMYNLVGASVKLLMHIVKTEVLSVKDYRNNVLTVAFNSVSISILLYIFLT